MKNPFSRKNRRARKRQSEQKPEGTTPPSNTAPVYRGVDTAMAVNAGETDGEDFKEASQKGFIHSLAARLTPERPNVRRDEIDNFIGVFAFALAFGLQHDGKLTPANIDRINAKLGEVDIDDAVIRQDDDDIRRSAGLWKQAVEEQKHEPVALVDYHIRLFADRKNGTRVICSKGMNATYALDSLPMRFNGGYTEENESIGNGELMTIRALGEAHVVLEVEGVKEKGLTLTASSDPYVVTHELVQDRSFSLRASLPPPPVPLG